jgi:bifunctional DNase/RNase
MTHDLLRGVLQKLSISVTRIVVTEVKDNTYHAEIHLANNGTTMVLDSRPSDAIALALRAEAPIFVAPTVAEQAIVLKKPLDEKEMEDFRKFLESVKPSDFKGTVH